MFKAPIYSTDATRILLRTASRINRLADVAKTRHPDMELVPGVKSSVGEEIYWGPRFRWTEFLRDAYLALTLLPADDVEAHHIKGMLTEATEMFQDRVPFRALAHSVTMNVVKDMDAEAVDIVAGYKEDVTKLDAVDANFVEPGNDLHLKFRLDLSREIGMVPMQELQRALASLPFDITLTTPTKRATLLDSVPQLNGMMINIIPADVMHDFHRFRLQYTFDKIIEDQLVRDLIKERMHERKIGGSVSWQIDSLVITATCAEKDTLADAIQWRCKVEEELMEVLSSLTSSPDGYIR